MDEVALREEYNKYSTAMEQLFFLREMVSPAFTNKKMMSVFGITRQRVNQVPVVGLLESAFVFPVAELFESATNAECPSGPLNPLS